MPKYWGKQIFTHGIFPKVGQKQKTEKRRRRKKKKKRTEQWPPMHCKRHLGWHTQSRLGQLITINVCKVYEVDYY